MKVVVDGRRGRLHWGVAVAAVYGVFATSTIGFVAFALGQPVDLVSDDYYARSLQQDEHAAAVRRADALVALSCRVTDDGRSLVVRVPHDAAQQAAGTLTLYRPSDGRADRATPLALGPNGVQVLSLAGLARGRWRVQLDWRAAGGHYYHEQDLDLR